ncbi:urease accessory protein UreD [Yoonia sp. BS5-3]|uniref:Urease accessory protein UreD n=1 Tax=Yoonia phaeophyticola TaxID=3137369 RepID=A0ABZ2V3X3_9RHOB
MTRFCWSSLASLPVSLAVCPAKTDRQDPTITYAAEIRTTDAEPLAPRAQGVLRLAAKRRDAQTVIADLRQEGSLKALFPQVRGHALDAVFLNTAGGLTGGDRMQIDIQAQADAHVIVSSQAAERAYRAQPNQIAQSEVRLQAAPGGRIDWLPQETILFDQAALNRRLEVRLAGDASALLVEPIIFGRAAMGETVETLHLRDQWRVWRDDELVFADAVRLIGKAQQMLRETAIGGGAAAMATVLFASPQAAAFAERLTLPDTSGVSLIRDDVLLVRMLAADGFALRKQVIPVVEALSTAPIPRVWRL